MVRIQSWITNN